MNELQTRLLERILLISENSRSLDASGSRFRNVLCTILRENGGEDCEDQGCLPRHIQGSVEVCAILCAVSDRLCVGEVLCDCVCTVFELIYDFL